MAQLQEVLDRLKKAKREEFAFIAGRYKHEPQDRVDLFVASIAWFTIGVIVGLVVAGCIEHLSY